MLICGLDPKVNKRASVRDTVVVAEHAALEAPNQSDVEIPSSHQALRSKHEFGNLFFGQSSPDLVCYTDVGSVLSCK